MTLAGDIPQKKEMMNKVFALLAASAAALALTVAGCGGSGGSDSSSPGSSGSKSGSSSSKSGASGSNANPTLEQAVKFAQCMRENGVTNFPDPDKDGRFVIAAGGPNRNTPQFRNALQACKSLQPPGFLKDDPAEVAREQEAWLKWAQCMRKNGIPNMPDPQDGRLRVPRDRINVNSPQFKNALKVCRDAGGGLQNGRG
jgi:hypothetical protein